jgi:hypothetical protein
MYNLNSVEPSLSCVACVRKPISSNTTIIQNTSGFHLDDIDVQFQHGSFKSNVTGKLRVTDQTLWSTLDIRGEAARTQDLFELLGFGLKELNELQPFTISTSLSGENDFFKSKMEILVLRIASLMYPSPVKLNLPTAI